MSSRVWLTVGVAIAAVVVGGWRMLLPAPSSTANSVGDGVSSIIATTTRAAFTASAASLDAQRSATGSYGGAHLPPGMELVRADAASYCVQTQRGPLVLHETGPGSSPTIGPC